MLLCYVIKNGVLLHHMAFYVIKNDVFVIKNGVYVIKNGVYMISGVYVIKNGVLLHLYFTLWFTSPSPYGVLLHVM